MSRVVKGKIIFVHMHSTVSTYNALLDIVTELTALNAVAEFA